VAWREQERRARIAPRVVEQPRLDVVGQNVPPAAR
jgi:hypothetical protein